MLHITRVIICNCYYFNIFELSIIIKLRSILLFNSLFICAMFLLCFILFCHDCIICVQCIFNIYYEIKYNILQSFAYLLPSKFRYLCNLFGNIKLFVLIYMVAQMYWQCKVCNPMHLMTCICTKVKVVAFDLYLVLLGMH